jgi:hypothetical protein
VAELGGVVRAARSASDPRCRGGGEATEASAGLPGRARSGQRLNGTARVGAGTWRPRGDGALTSRPTVERERLTGGTPRQRFFSN